ncbi:lipoprotein N-acyltransferase Lnb domain-containing protein [Yeosuana sp. AK3]
MLKKLLYTILFLIFNTTFSQTNSLSPNAEISILTIAPGRSLNDAFGHNAIRIKDATLNLDVTFDYGRYDFNAPNFYLNFARGKLNYAIGVSDYYDFLKFYKWQQRRVDEQVLNLTKIQKETLYKHLATNYKPENRAYLYDFFYDNCATKIKDVINIATNNVIEFNPPEKFETKTFRTLIQEKLDWNTWGSLGIDIALGSVIDQKATPEEHMFLPSYIHTFFKLATFKNNQLPLVKESKTIYDQKIATSSPSVFLSPLFIFGLLSLMILWITYKDFKKQHQTKWLDIVLFVLTGVVGVGILLLWFATDHKATHQNYNLLWACALNLLVIGQLFKKTPKAWFIKYLKFLVILLCLLTLHWSIGVQVFALGLLPFLVALGIRYLFLIQCYKNKCL